MLWMKKTFTDFLIEKWKWILCVWKDYLVHDLYFVYVVEAFITLKHVEANFIMWVLKQTIIIPTKFEKIQRLQSWTYQVGVAHEFSLSLNLDDGVDVDLGLKHTHIYKIGKHTCENVNFQNWSLYASSRGSQSFLTRWWVSRILNSNVIFRVC